MKIPLKPTCAWIQSKSAFENLSTIHEKVVGIWIPPMNVYSLEFRKPTNNPNSIHERIIKFVSCANKQKRSDLHSIKVLRFKTCAKNHEIPICMQTKQLTICIQIITSKIILSFSRWIYTTKKGGPYGGPFYARSQICCACKARS